MTGFSQVSFMALRSIETHVCMRADPSRATD
jgi:hypothetical protein